MNSLPLVSFFESVTDTQPLGHYALDEILLRIKNEAYRDDISSLRHLKSAGHARKAKEIKNGLDAFTPSGTFAYRNAEGIVEYSHIMSLDFDDIPEQQLTPTKDRINGDKHTLSCFLSPSGTGLKVLVRVNSEAARHKEAYEFVNRYYANLIGINSDSNCKDVSRLCFMSSDPEIYINWDSAAFEIPRNDANTTNSTSYKWRKQLDECRSYTSRRESFVESNRNNYVHQFSCNANRRGIPQDLTSAYCVESFNQGGFSAEEIVATVKSGYRHVNETGIQCVTPTDVFVPSVLEIIDEHRLAPSPEVVWPGVKIPSVGFIFGPSKTGKSTLSEALGIAVALGRSDFFERPIPKARRVLLVSLEEFGPLRSERLAKQTAKLSDQERPTLQENYKMTPSEFPQYIDRQEHWELLEAYVESCGAEFVILDSLSHVTNGGSIEDSSAATEIMQKLRTIAHNQQAAIAVIHHTPKDVSTGKPLCISSNQSGPLTLNC